MGGASSSTAPTLPPDDVIMEILLRVPPEPIYLLRVSLVCNKLRDLVRDPVFLRRFQARHRHAGPLVGFFREDGSFVPAGEPPDRVSAAHFSQLHGVGGWRVFDSRHGRILLSAGSWHGDELELLVWDPMTGHQTYFAPPRHVVLEYLAAGGRTFFTRRDRLAEPPCSRAALLCDHDGDGEDRYCHSRPFRVVLMCINHGTMFAGVYSSLTGAWGDVTRVHGRRCRSVGPWEPNSVLAGNAVYWPERHGTQLLGYNLSTNRFQHVQGFHLDDDPFDCVQVFRAGDGELGLAAVFESDLYLFAAVATEHEDTAMWEECRALDLDARLPPAAQPVGSSSPPPVRRAEALGFDEEGNKIFLDFGDGVFALQLDSLKVNKVLEAGMLPYMDDCIMIPYMSFFVAASTGGDDGANEEAAQQQM